MLAALRFLLSSQNSAPIGSARTWHKALYCLLVISTWCLALLVVPTTSVGWEKLQLAEPRSTTMFTRCGAFGNGQASRRNDIHDKDNMLKINLDGHLALVTGASTGIGAGTAKALACAGADVILAGRDVSALERVAAQVEAEGRKASLVSADLATLGGVEAVCEHVLTSSRRPLDILVNNVGASLPTGLDASDDFWDHAFDLNFSAARRLTQRFLPSMLEEGWGRVISVSGSMEPRSLNAATAAKGALHLWSKGLSSDVAKEGVTVNCVAPGRITSAQTMERLHPDEVARARFIETNIPAGRFGEGLEMGYTIAFLASDLAAYVTGSVIPVDGGMHTFAH